MFKDKPIVKLRDYKAFYNVKIQNNLVASDKDRTLSLQTISKYEITQSVKNSDIINSYRLIEMEGEANNQEFELAVQKSVDISKILKRIEFQRDKSGRIISIINNSVLQKDWQKWKEKELDNFLTKLGEQEEFIKIIERGLANLNENIKNELQYIALFPECYHFKEYLSLKKEYTSQYIFSSRLANKTEVKYKFTPKEIITTDGKVKVWLHSVVTNEQEVLSDIQEINNSDIPVKYSFGIKVKYEMDRNSGKLISSQVELEESINDDIKYKIKVETEEINKEIEKGVEIYKTYQGKNYTQEEWKQFEEEQFKIYAKKHNLPIDKKEEPQANKKYPPSIFLD